MLFVSMYKFVMVHVCWSRCGLIIIIILLYCLNEDNQLVRFVLRLVEPTV